MKQTVNECLDNKAAREVYDDMRRQGHINGMRYDTYLCRLKERNTAARREEYNERRIKTRLDFKEIYGN